LFRRVALRIPYALPAAFLVCAICTGYTASTETDRGIVYMPEKTGKIARPLAMLMMIGGCATVNPQHDYDRVGRRVIEATGQDRVYRPEDDALVDELVKGLLRDGISADEATQISLLNSPSLQAAFMDIGMARADAVQAGLFSNPFLGISARFPDSGGLANIEASVSQNIAELWQIPVRRLAAERSLDAGILNLARTAADVAADAKAAYYVAVGADERLRIAQENRDISKNLLDLALTRQKAGAANELDVNLSRGIALDAEIEVERARLAAADARRNLATILGLTSDADVFVLTSEPPVGPYQQRKRIWNTNTPVSGRSSNSALLWNDRNAPGKAVAMS